jgi:1,2-diacylglycerol 3-beta-glucosyltransferase
MDILLWIVQAVVGVGSLIAMVHYCIVAYASRGGSISPRRTSSATPLRYVFMVPCLNEEMVIAATIERLLKYRERPDIWIIDDGSDDATPAIVQAYARSTGGQVRHMRRDAPNARKGKGAALNACYREMVREYSAEGIDPGQIVVCVMDADGLLDPNALRAVDRHFADPRVGGAQVAVRIRNRETFRGRLQDADFFVFGTILQNGRNRIGSVGLGGNGQFTRLSALMSLGDTPWTDCLTEDLDLGLQMIIKGWRLVFTNRTAVHQEGLVDVDKLVRQRTRWAQGQFQCWKRVPELLRMRAPWYTKADLVYHLLWPAMTCLLFPLAVLAAWLLFILNVFQGMSLSPESLVPPMLTYMIAFMPGVMIALYYRSWSRDLSFPRALVMAHLMPLYQFIWLVAGWKAVGRMISKKNGWAKTARIGTGASQPAAVPAPVSVVDAPSIAKLRLGIPLVFLVFLVASVLQAFIAPQSRA